jgi:hypothetical protein
MKAAGYVKFALLVVVVTTAVALAVPNRSSTAVRVAIFLLAATGAVALVDLARGRSPVPDESPFEPRRRAAPSPRPPVDLMRLGVELRALELASAGDTATVVPSALRRTMRAIAASRLSQHHGLRLDDDGDGPACASACGQLLWTALDGEPVTASADDLVSAVEQL